VTRFFDVDAASAALTDVAPILELLRDQRTELIELRDEAAELQAAIAANQPLGDAGGGSGSGGGRRRPRRSPEATRAAAEFRVVRLRMQGVIDQMQAGVARIEELGITLRDIETGLIDFPALASGRQIWLCWRLGEGPVAWWHELTTGVAGRLPLADLA
jgi:hypothetical protein